MEASEVKLYFALRELVDQFGIDGVLFQLSTVAESTTEPVAARKEYDTIAHKLRDCWMESKVSQITCELMLSKADN